MNQIELYDLSIDISETINLANDYPDVVAKIQALGDEIRSELGDALTGIKGTGQRSSGKVDDE